VSVCQCLSVRLSEASIVLKHLDGLNSFRYGSYSWLITYEGNLGISDICGISLLNSAPISGLGEFRHGTTTASIVNIVRPSTVASFITLSVYHCVEQSGRDSVRRAGSSATAETCTLSHSWHKYSMQLLARASGM